jgi:FkbM family methyltransferase
MPFISDAFRYMRAYLIAARKPKRNRLGFYINGNFDQSEGIYEVEIANHLETNHFRYDRVINIGANIGYWPLFLRSINYVGRIDAIEPDFYNFKQLKRNLEHNKFTEIILHNKAVSNTYEKIKLYGFGTGVSSLRGWAGGFSSRQQEVDCIKLDDLLDDNYKKTLLIIDVEGAELDVLQSSKNFLNADTEVLVEVTLVEHVPSGNKVNPNFAKTFDFMESYKYSPYAWVNELSLLNNDKVLAITNGEIIPSIQMYYFKK